MELSDLIERLNSMSPGKRHHFLKHIPTYFAETFQTERLYRVLTDLEFMHIKIDELGLGPQALIEDYGLAFKPSIVISTETSDELEQYRNFIQRHAQRLEKYKGLFFTLIYREGFPAAQAKAQELASQGLWTKPWLRTSPAWMPFHRKADATTESIEMLKRWAFEASCAVTLAKERQLAFFVKRLGRIRIVDLERGYELPGKEVETRNHSRPLAIFCSVDAQYLAVAYENGEADLLNLDYNQDGIFIDSERIKTFEYLVPESEAPIMEFENDFLWYQAISGSIMKLHLAQREISDEFEIGAGELSGLVPIDEQCVITLRCGQDTHLVILEAGRSVSSLYCERTDVACFCACGSHQVAIAFTNHKLVVFDTSIGIIPMYETTLDEPPACIVWRGEALVWISRRGGTLHAWKIEASDGLRDFTGDGSLFAMAHRLAIGLNGTFAVATSTGALSFRLKQGDSQRLYPLRTVFEAGRKEAYYAIQERENEIWLLDGFSKKEMQIDSGLYSSHTFAMDGKHHLLSTRITGHGVAIELIGHKIKEVPEIPQGIVSTAGNLEGGFWLTDDFGAIYFTALDGVCQKVSQVSLEIVGNSQLQSWPGLLLWSGLALHRTELGEDRVQVLVFFQPDKKRPGVLHKIGQRFFKLAHGRFQALAYDSNYSRLLVVWYGGSRFEHGVKFGAVRDFIAEYEDEQPITNVDSDIIASKVAADISGLYLLSKSGNLFLLDTQPLNEKRLDKKALPIQAILSGSVPLTGMTQGICQDTSLTLIEAGSRLFFCGFERSSVK